MCAAEPSWIGYTGRGTVHTFTAIRQNGTPGFVDELPYVVAMIDLGEGVRVMGNVLDAAVDDVHIGVAVEVVLVPVDDEIAVPQWRACGPLTRPRLATPRLRYPPTACGRASGRLGALVA